MSFSLEVHFFQLCWIHISKNEMEKKSVLKLEEPLLMQGSYNTKRYLNLAGQ